MTTASIAPIRAIAPKTCFDRSCTIAPSYSNIAADWAEYELRRVISSTRDLSNTVTRSPTLTGFGVADLLVSA